MEKPEAAARLADAVRRLRDARQRFASVSADLPPEDPEVVALMEELLRLESVEEVQLDAFDAASPHSTTR